MFKFILELITLVTIFIPTVLADYTVTTEPWPTDSPVPGSIIYYDIQFGADDPALVDILLFNSNRGNTTTIFGERDLRKKEDSNSHFDVPVCPPGKYAIRLVETSSKRFLVDSLQFDVFAVNTSSPSPSDPSTSNTPTPSSTPSGDFKDTPRSTTKTLPIGPIVGGAVGGLVLVSAIVVIIFACRRRGFRSSKSSAEDDYIPPRKLPFPETGDVQPFTLSPREEVGFGIELDSTYPGGHSFATGSTIGGSAGPLPYKSRTNLAQGYGVGIAEQQSSPTSGSSTHVPSGSDHINLERERINDEIAALEGRNITGYNATASTTEWSGHSSSSSGGHSYPQGQGLVDIAAQVAALRDHIRQMEARQTYVTNAGIVELEPPPGYDGSPAASSRLELPSLPPQTSLDTKEPLS